MAVALACLNVRAQVISFNDKEVKVMRELIRDDDSPSFKKVFTPFERTAQSAMTEAPNPIDEIRSQGLLEGNPQKTASLNSVKDAYKIYALALEYQYSKTRKYLKKATGYLLAWAHTNHASGDPINETKLEDMFTAYDLIRRDIAKTDRDSIDRWMKSIADAEVNSKSAQPGRGTAINNWNSHRIKIITLIAYTLHDSSYYALVNTLMEKQLEINLNADGTTHDLMERDAFHYHTYDIEPLLSAAIAIYRASGKNYFTYQTSKGASLKKSVDYMIPFMTGEKIHPEFVKSTVPFDKKRAQNNEKGYAAGTLFKPEGGLYTFSLAAFFDPAYLNVIHKASKQGDAYFNWQLAQNRIREIAAGK